MRAKVPTEAAMNKPTLALSLSERASLGATVRPFHIHTHTRIVEPARWKILPSEHIYGFPLCSHYLFALFGGGPVSEVEQGEGVVGVVGEEEVLPGPDGC